MSKKVWFPDSNRHNYFFRQLQGSSDDILELGTRHAITTIVYNIRHRFGSPNLDEFVRAGSAAFQDCLKGLWKVEQEKYQALTFKDYDKFLSDFVPLMTNGDTNLFVDDTLALHFNWGDPSFTAQISPIPGKSLDNQQIYLSGGVMMALDDLALRAFCNQAFFSWDIPTWTQKWSGCSCYFSRLGEHYVRPRLRYANYSVDTSDLFEGAVGNRRYHLGLGPLFYSGVPLGDTERMRAAGFAAKVALAWVLAHESAHYFQGHFHLMRDHPGMFAQGSPSRAQNLWMAEGTAHPSPASNSEVSRFLEWQADKGATEAIIDMFLNPDQAEKLPSYCKPQGLWLYRLIVVSMVMAALIFDRMSMALGAAESHPRGLARLIGIIITADRRLSLLTSPGPLYDAELSAFMGELTFEENLEQQHTRVASVFLDALVVAEIIENENTEGLEGNRYVFPTSNNLDENQWLIFETLITMFKQPLKDHWRMVRDDLGIRMPEGRWATSIFEEVRGYLQDETQSPLSAELTGHNRALRRFHEAKLTAKTKDKWKR